MKAESKLWLMQAEKDLVSAKKNLKINEYHLVGYLCHQSVEKGLKSLLISMKGKVIKTHDLVFLSKEVNSPEEITNICKRLNPVYIEVRYPDASHLSYEYNMEDAVSFIKDCGDVLSWIKKNL